MDIGFDGLGWTSWTRRACKVVGCKENGSSVLVRGKTIAEYRCEMHVREIRVLDLPKYDIIEPFPNDYEPKKRIEEFFYGESSSGNKIHICMLDPPHMWLENNISFTSYCGGKVTIHDSSVFRVSAPTILGPIQQWSGSRLCSKCTSGGAMRFGERQPE